MDTHAIVQTGFLRQTGDVINEMIRSGRYKVLFDAIKGFRNGFVYGARIRFPHALVLNLVWSNAPYSVMARKVYEATKRHSLALGYSGFFFSLVRSLLRKLQGAEHPWHAAVAGFLLGMSFWGELSPITVQMCMYILSRILSAAFFIIMKKYGVRLPKNSFRIYSALLWAVVMPLFIYFGDTMQASMRSSMKYIYQENEQYSTWYDLFFVNSSTSF